MKWRRELSMTEEQWNAIKNRDESYDGKFYYGVKTTKKLMRPSCHSKLPNRENIEIFDTLEDAFANGYLPCQKCCPDRPAWSGCKQELVRSAQKLLRENCTGKFSLQELSDSLFVNKNYLARTFKEITGTTMLEYHNRLRCEKSMEYLHNPDYNLEYISSMVGYSSSSHYIRNFKKFYNCTPIEYRKAHDTQQHEKVPTL
jgi:AraC family transcriptional regulator of adaptative response / methylphosphotriester-DNA alkyltransferase methyltransferase